MYEIDIVFLVKVELSDFRLLLKLSTYLSHHGFFLCFKQFLRVMNVVNSLIQVLVVFCFAFFSGKILKFVQV